MSSELQAILFSLLSAVVGFIVVFFQVKTKEQKAKLEKIEDEHVMSVPLLSSFNKYSEEQKQRFATITIDDIPEDILNTQ